MTRLAAILAAVAAIALLAWLAIASAGSGASAYRVEALFDNAGFAVPGEQVRISGAPVGTISGLAVTRQSLAAVTLSITNPDFRPWHANATCTIRPQSLIAERYVDCTPGTANEPLLRRIAGGAGAGAHLLPVTRTSSPIDPDIVQDVSQQSVRESLSLILDELGTGLAGRGADLKAVILRANPGLAQTERVFNLLASQNRVLARLATDSDTVLAPLARARRSLAGFVVHANTTASAAASEQAQLAASIRLLPPFLHRLRPLMSDLGQLADQGTPLVTDAGAGAGALDTEFRELVPFAQRARTAITNLGNAAAGSERSLVASQGLAQQLLALGTVSKPSAQALDKLLTSLEKSGGIDALMSLLFDGAGATNGYNADGHYVRLSPVVGPCTAYARTAVAGCSADFSSATSAAAAAVASRAVEQTVGSSKGQGRQAAPLGGLLRYLTGSGG